MFIIQKSMSKKPKSPKGVELKTDNFGFIREKDKQLEIKRFTWKNSNRIQVQVITFGATITSVRYPNKKGIIEDVVLGFDEINSYRTYHNFNFGSTIGRVANYIKRGSFTLGKKIINLNCNSGKHHYNGGAKGFEQAIWNDHVNGNKLILSHLSPDNDEGYPGDLLVFATFELTDANEFRIEYRATVSKPTIINITNHCYFNLAGHASGESELRRHTIMINADCHIKLDDDSLPTGEIQSVLNTDYDMQTPTKVDALLHKLSDLNNNLCVNRGIEQQGITFIGRLYHKPSGRIIEVYSNQYGVQIDTANNLPLVIESLQIQESSIISKLSKNPYLHDNVGTFDMLDEIYNKFSELKFIEKSDNYNEIMDVIQNLVSKSSSVYRDGVLPDAQQYVKRSVLVLENLPVYQLTSIQAKYLERILKGIDKLDEVTAGVEAIRTIILVTLDHHNVRAAQEALERKKHSPSQEMTHKIIQGKKGAKYNKHGAISLQCQNYPDAIHNPNFPCPILKPGQAYTNIIIYKFWIKTDESGISGVL